MKNNKTETTLHTVRKDEYSILKVIAVLLVVIGHTTKFYSEEGSVIPFATVNGLNVITTIIYAFHMPLFVFTSGAIYRFCIDNGKYQNFKVFLRNKSKRLLLPYFIWALLYVLPVMYFLHLITNPFDYLINGIIFNFDSRHLWYLYTLFQMLLLTRLLKSLFEKFPWLQYIVLVVSVVFSQFYYYTPSFFSYFGITIFCKFYCYFMFGYMFENKKELINRIIDKHKVISGAIAMLLLCAILFSIGKIPRVIAAIIIINILYILVRCLKNRLTNHRFYEKIQKNSMGIYLIHPMIIYTLFSLMQSVQLSPYLLCLFIIIIAFSTSYILSVLLHKCKLNWVLSE